MESRMAFASSTRILQRRRLPSGSAPRSVRVGSSVNYGRVGSPRRLRGSARNGETRARSRALANRDYARTARSHGGA